MMFYKNRTSHKLNVLHLVTSATQFISCIYHRFTAIWCDFHRHSPGSARCKAASQLMQFRSARAPPLCWEKTALAHIRIYLYINICEFVGIDTGVRHVSLKCDFCFWRAGKWYTASLICGSAIWALLNKNTLACDRQRERETDG